MDGQKGPQSVKHHSPQVPGQGATPPQPRLVREVMDPFRRFHLGTFTFVTTGLLALTTGVIMVGARSLPHRPHAVVIHTDDPNPVAFDRAGVATPSFEAPAAPPVPANADFVFVVDAGNRRFALLRAIEGTDASGIEAAEHLRPYRGARVLGDPDYPAGGVIPVDQDDLPADVRSWRGRKLTVANTCTTRVGDIVRVSLLTGDPDYYGGDFDPSAQGRLDYVFGAGRHYYAAEVSSCGTGEWARMSTLPEASTPVDLGPAPASLRAQARTTVMRSAASQAVQERWREDGRSGLWYQDTPSDSLALDYHYVLHPRTGQRWLIVHVTSDYECGGVMANLLGVFRVSDDGHIQDWSVRQIEPVTIDDLIDIDGDGRFELRGQTWLSGPVLINNLGNVEAEAEIPFYGCPC